MGTEVRPDTGEIRRAMQVILEPGQVTELRAVDVVEPNYRRPHIVSGYFDTAHLAQFAQAAAAVSAKGVYFIPNVVKPALLARAANRARAVDGKEPTTSDGDVLSRRWLLVDADPCRPAGISSTQAEHEAALTLAAEIRAWLTSIGWPSPILADSGNGAHLLYRTDLPADDGGLLSRVLGALAARFDTEAVIIDLKTFNPSRIWKLYGTVARKGDDMPDRPHRLARMLDVPTDLQPVDRTLLDGMAGAAPVTTEGEQVAGGRPFDLAGWITEHSLAVAHEGPWNGEGYRWILRDCPWNAAHTNRSAFIVRRADGMIGAGCQHNGCQGKGWHALRDVVEPGWREKRRSQGRPPDQSLLQKTIDHQAREIARLRKELADLKAKAHPAIKAPTPIRVEAPPLRLVALRGIDL